MERRSAPDELRFSDDDLLSFGSSVRPDSPYKLLAVDLDGTVLSRDGVPHAIDRAAIARLRDHGVPTTIVTGRLYSGSREIARTLGIEGPIACVDGSVSPAAASSVIASAAGSAWRALGFFEVASATDARRSCVSGGVTP